MRSVQAVKRPSRFGCNHSFNPVGGPASRSQSLIGNALADETLFRLAGNKERETEFPGQARSKTEFWNEVHGVNEYLQHRYQNLEDFRLSHYKRLLKTRSKRDKGRRGSAVLPKFV